MRVTPRVTKFILNGVDSSWLTSGNKMRIPIFIALGFALSGQILCVHGQSLDAKSLVDLVQKKIDDLAFRSISGTQTETLVDPKLSRACYELAATSFTARASRRPANTM
jgi:hypothetical protein